MANFYFPKLRAALNFKKPGATPVPNRLSDNKRPDEIIVVHSIYNPYCLC